MERGSTIFLRAAICFIGLVALLICMVAFRSGISASDADYYRPIVLGLLVPAMPFFIALFQTLKLLGYIDKNKAFSEQSIRSIRIIKLCAVAISGIFAAGMPYIYYAADRDDAPGVVAIALVIVFASFVIATAAAVLQRLVQNAVDIKSENDLTV